MLGSIRTALWNILLFTVVTGILYPLLVWGIGIGSMPWQARGSLVERNGIVVGSLRIGQNFHSPEYFQGRPSMTGGSPYNPMASGGSNYACGNPAQEDSVKLRRKNLCFWNDCGPGEPPAELLEASASGLDPEITLSAALFQVKRIARARKIKETGLVALIYGNAIPPLLDIFGTERVNVLQLNLALDRKFGKEN